MRMSSPIEQLRGMHGLICGSTGNLRRKPLINHATYE
jgi:hypothetical protein